MLGYVPCQHLYPPRIAAYSRKKGSSTGTGPQRPLRGGTFFSRGRAVSCLWMALALEL